MPHTKHTLVASVTTVTEGTGVQSGLTPCVCVWVCLVQVVGYLPQHILSQLS